MASRPALAAAEEVEVALLVGLALEVEDDDCAMATWHQSMVHSNSSGKGMRRPVVVGWRSEDDMMEGVYVQESSGA